MSECVEERESERKRTSERERERARERESERARERKREVSMGRYPWSVMIWAHSNI